MKFFYHYIKILKAQNFLITCSFFKKFCDVDVHILCNRESFTARYHEAALLFRHHSSSYLSNQERRKHLKLGGHNTSRALFPYEKGGIF